MKKFFKQIKLEFFYWRKCIFQYHQFWHYIYNKYILAPKILKLDKILEKPISQTDLSIHILTCHRDLIMAIWSLTSFYIHPNIIGKLYIHNDGSLTDKDKTYFKKFFPSCQIIEEQDVKDNYNKLDEYQEIKKIRIEKTKKYFLIKKLLDPYLISNKKFILVIDADLLWFEASRGVKSEIKKVKIENSSLMMANNSKSFVYFKENKKIEDELATYNSGIVFYKKDNYNLEKLTEYFKQIDYSNSKNKHFIEQAGYAYCLKKLQKLPKNRYTIKENINDEIIVKHYTSPRRPLFYIEGVKKIKEKIL